jgi:hypothetical protein
MSANGDFDHVRRKRRTRMIRQLDPRIFLHLSADADADDDGNDAVEEGHPDDDNDGDDDGDDPLQQDLLSHGARVVGGLFRAFYGGNEEPSSSAPTEAAPGAKPSAQRRKNKKRDRNVITTTSEDITKTRIEKLLDAIHVDDDKKKNDNDRDMDDSPATVDAETDDEFFDVNETASSHGDDDQERNEELILGRSHLLPWNLAGTTTQAWAPIVQVPLALTSDMLEHQARLFESLGDTPDGRQLRRKMQCANLVSGMHLLLLICRIIDVQSNSVFRILMSMQTCRRLRQRILVHLLVTFVDGTALEILIRRHQRYPLA